MSLLYPQLQAATSFSSFILCEYRTPMQSILSTSINDTKTLHLHVHVTVLYGHIHTVQSTYHTLNVTQFNTGHKLWRQIVTE